MLADAEVILPLEGLIDKQAELAKLSKALADLDRQLGPLRAKLGNEAFVSRAPAEVVEAQRTKLAELENPAGHGRGPRRKTIARLSTPCTLCRALTTAGEALMINRDQMRNRRLPVIGR